MFLKRLSVILIFVSLLASLSGCQKTPDEALVKNKKGENLEQEIRDSSLKETPKGEENERDTFPEHYQDEFEVNGVVVQVDADIILPDTGKIASEKIIPQNFSAEQVREFIRYFAGENNCYPLNVAGSKEEIENQIVLIRQQIAELKKNGAAGINEGDGTAQEQIAVLEEELKQYEEYYQQAGESQPVDINEVSFDENGAIELQTYLGRASRALLLCYDYDEMGTLFEFLNYSSALNADEEKLEVGITKEEAWAMASEVIEELNLGDLRMKDIKIKGQVVDGRITGYYDILCQRNWGGLPNRRIDEAPVVQTDLPVSQEEQETEIYSPIMGQNDESIQVDETGVIGMSVTAPPEAVETLNEDVAVCGFDELKEYFRENIGKKSWKNPAGKTYLKITRIYLSSMYAVNKNSSQEYFTLPVWDFCGYSYGEDTPEDTAAHLARLAQDGDQELTFLTLNALDGSMVSRKTGY